MRNYRITALSTAFLLALSVGGLRAWAQTSDTTATVGEDFYRNTYFAVGLNASLLSGTGLGARMSLPGGFTAQTAFFVVTVGEYLHFNIGGEAQYAFSRNRSGRLYSLFGVGYYNTDSDDTTKPGNRIANPIRLGLGLGYEWFTSRQLVISIAGAITYFPSTSEVYPLPEIGLYYYFR